MWLDLQFAADTKQGEQIALRDQFFNLLAVITVADKYVPDKAAEAQGVFRTTDQSHPGVDYLMNSAGSVYIGGKVEGVQRPLHYDFLDLRRTPTELREHLQGLGWSNFLAFQTRNPMHRAHIELTRLAADQTSLGVVIHPVVGMTKPGDVSYHVRVLCYKTMIATHKYYKRKGVVLSLLPLAMRMAGPREALWHALIRKNHGASHFIVGRDHAGCKSAAGDDFYGAYDAQELVGSVAEEVGITIVPFQKVVYVPSMSKYLPQDKVPKGVDTLAISGTKFRAMMAAGKAIPEWFSEPKVIKILQMVAPPRPKRGFVLFFTGLSGGGKTTIAHALQARLRELLPTRHLTVLDGDVVRTHLSKELGFSVADRNTNVARMGFVAAEAARHGGIVIASTISPFEKARAESRALVEGAGGAFVLVHVSTSAAECARRDVKGLYAKANTGAIEVTGVNHPYEQPSKPDLVIDAEKVAVSTSVNSILRWLNVEGYLEDDVLGSDVLSLDLQELGFLSTGKPDPAFQRCSLQAAGTAGSSLPRLVFTVAPNTEPITKVDGEAFARTIVAPYADLWRGTLNRFSEQNPSKAKKGAIVTVLSKDLDAAATAVLAARKVQVPAGTSVHALVTADDRIEVAFALWGSVRSSSAKAAGVTPTALKADLVGAATSITGAPENVLVSLPVEAVPYLENIMRQDPCATAVLLGGGQGEQQPAETTASFWAQYTTSIESLRNKFPLRAALVDKAGGSPVPEGVEGAATAASVLSGELFQ